MAALRSRHTRKTNTGVLYILFSKKSITQIYIMMAALRSRHTRSKSINRIIAWITRVANQIGFDATTSQHHQTNYHDYLFHARIIKNFVANVNL